MDRIVYIYHIPRKLRKRPLFPGVNPSHGVLPVNWLPVVSERYTARTDQLQTADSRKLAVKRLTTLASAAPVWCAAPGVIDTCLLSVAPGVIDASSLWRSVTVLRPLCAQPARTGTDQKRQPVNRPAYRCSIRHTIWSGLLSRMMMRRVSFTFHTLRLWIGFTAVGLVR